MTGTDQKKPQLLVLGAEHLHRKASYGRDDYRDFVIHKVQRMPHRDDAPLEGEIVALPYTFCLDIRGRADAVTCSAPLMLVATAERQVLHTLQSGSTVCFLTQSLVSCTEPRDEYTELEQIYNCLGFDDEALRRHVIGHRMLKNLGITPHFGGELTSSYQVKRGEFRSYLGRYAAGKTSFMADNPEDIDPICLDSQNMVAGFCKAHDKGFVVFLPYLREETQDFDQAMASLARGIFTYLSGLAEQEPQWARSLVFAEEAQLRDKLRKAEERAGKLRSELASFEQLRQVLWQRGPSLQQSVSGLFNRLGLDTRDDESLGEGFWMNLDGRDAVLVEVKSIPGNIAPQDIAAVGEHRKARGLPEDFPSLLVASTFANLQSVTAKDKRIEPALCKAAVDAHTLVMRTIDLVRLYDVVSSGRLQVSLLQDTLLHQAGWLMVEPGGYQIITG
jgi:hypothetical protein